LPLFIPQTASGNITVSKGGAPVGSRPAINLIEGSNVALTVADNAGAADVDVTVSTSVGATSSAGMYLVGTMNSFGEGSIVGDVVQNVSQNFTQVGSWSTANRAYFIPVQVLTTITVYKMSWLNGSTVGTNNADVGIYNSAYTRLVSSGGTLTAGANSIQIVDVADTVLTPDTYFLAMVMNGISGDVIFRSTASGRHMRTSGVLMQSTAYPLPATAAPVGNTDSFCPSVAAHFESSVV
jgi:hypothetical protein